MSQFDRFTTTLVSQYDGVSMNNTIHWQIVDEQDASTALSDLADFVETFLTITLAPKLINALTFTQIIVRRLKPAITDVLVKDVNISGGESGSGLPSTCVMQQDYYCDPYEAKQHNHWKWAGLPMNANNRGNITEEYLIMWEGVIQFVTQSPYVAGNNGYAIVRPLKSEDVPGVAAPIVAKSFVQGRIRNFRPRQLY